MGGLALESFWRTSVLRQGLLVVLLASLLTAGAVHLLGDPWVQLAVIVLVNSSAALVLYAGFRRVVQLLSMGTKTSLDYRIFPKEMHRLAYTIAVERYALLESRSLLETIIEAVPSGVLVVDHEAHVVVFNTAAASLFGIDPKQVVGSSLQQLTELLGIEPMTFPLWETVQTGEPRDVRRTVELRGKTIILDMCTVSVKGPKGCMLHLCVADDITTKVTLEQDVLHAEKMKLMEQLAGSVAHEVRNPLTTIKGYCQLFSSKPEFAHYKKIMDLMVDEADRASDIIASYLTLARQNPAQRQKTDLNELLQISIKIVDGLAKRTGVDLVTTLAPLPSVSVDRTAVKQLFIHLLRNALEATPFGGSITVTSAVNLDERTLSFTFRDNGSGISPEVLTKVREPFFTTKDNNSGLGLSICQTVVAEHGGNLAIDSTVGEGTTVTVVLPMVTKTYRED